MHKHARRRLGTSCRPICRGCDGVSWCGRAARARVTVQGHGWVVGLTSLLFCNFLPEGENEVPQIQGVFLFNTHVNTL